MRFQRRANEHACLGNGQACCSANSLTVSIHADFGTGASMPFSTGQRLFREKRL